MKNYHRIIYLILLFSSSIIAQDSTFKFGNEIIGVKEQWHKLRLTESVIGKLSNDMYDIRVLGIDNGDTLEVPYLLKFYDDKINDKKVSYDLINMDNNKKEFVYIFKAPNINFVNKLKLDFNINNFKWKVSLDASDNQNQWKSLFANKQIIGIDNELTTFKQTTIEFENSKYQYMRLTVKADSNPQLNTALFTFFDVDKGHFQHYTIAETDTKQDKKRKQTILEIQLKHRSPINRAKIHINTNYDYSRQFQLEYLSDSITNSLGKEYQYSLLCENSLNSMSKNEFTFNTTFVKTLRLTIDNFDNIPLPIDSITIDGYVYELVCRFPNTDSKYYLVYSNNSANKPNYDIENFENRIPNLMSDLQLGNEFEIQNNSFVDVKKDSLLNLLTNRYLLWSIMGAIILIIGWFTLKMLNSNQSKET